MVYDVFISHSNQDKAAAEATCAWLERYGIRCWIAPRDISPGAKWGGAIVKAIRSTRVMVLIFSSHTNASEQIMREVECAVKSRVTVIPVRIEDVVPKDDYEYFLSVAHWLDAFAPPLESHLDHLVVAIQGIMQLSPANGDAVVDPHEPPVVLHSVVEPPPAIHYHLPEPALPPPTPMPAPLPPPQYSAPLPQKKSPMLVIMVLLFVLGAGGALGWYFGVAKPTADQKILQAQADAAADEAALQRKLADEQAAEAAQAKADADQRVADQAAQAKAAAEEQAATDANARAATAEQAAQDAKAAADRATAAAAAAQASANNANTPAPVASIPPPPPIPTPPPPDQVQDNHNLNDFMRKWCDDNGSNDAGVWAADFAPRPLYCYYDDGADPATLDFIRDDRQKLIDRYPQRSYHFNNLSASMINDHQAHASIGFNYSYVRSTGSEANGRCDTQLDLAWDGSNWLITSYQETVHRQ